MARTPFRVALVALALLLAFAVPGATLAQESEGEAGAAPFAGGIHQGPCDQLAVEPITRLEPITFPPEAEQPPAGLESARPAATSTTPAHWWLVDLLADPHSIVIYESAEQPQDLLACGEIGGVVVDDELVIGLQEVEGSGVAGFAQLARQEDNSTAVTVIVSGDVDAARPPVAPDQEATPVADATPAPAATPVDADADAEAAAERVEVEAVDIDFNPNELTIPAGTEVTIVVTNTGATLHTFTIDELGIDEELQPGDTVEIPVNAEAGEYVYYCTVPGHREAGQEGTLIVQ